MQPNINKALEQALVLLSVFVAMSEGNKRSSTGGGEEAAKRHQKETVVWKVEEPSEFRKKAELENIGKDVENFRLFYDVSSHKMSIIIIIVFYYLRLTDKFSLAFNSPFITHNCTSLYM